MDKVKFLDKEEKDIMGSLENDGWVSDFNPQIKRRYQEYAKHSVNKQKRINIRMTERDLNKIRAKALQEGVPYQSLISMLIHKFNEGEVVLKRQKHA